MRKTVVTLRQEREEWLRALCDRVVENSQRLQRRSLLSLDLKQQATAAKIMEKEALARWFITFRFAQYNPQTDRQKLSETEQSQREHIKSDAFIEQTCIRRMFLKLLLKQQEQQRLVPELAPSMRATAFRNHLFAERKRRSLSATIYDRKPPVPDEARGMAALRQ